MAAALTDVLRFLDDRSRRREVADFPGAENGLQLENNGQVTRLGAAVDAGLEPFRMAASRGIDLLIVHHGLFWNPVTRFTGPTYQKLAVAVRANLAVYSCHLPLDAHPEIGNNALLAKALGLETERWFLPYEGTPIGLVARGGLARADIRERLRATLGTCTAMEFGPERPESIGILTGSGRSALPHLKAAGVDTLITGELRQEHFNFAQEHGLNLYLAGHYATETFGVRALAAEAAARFKLDWEFLDTGCPL